MVQAKKKKKILEADDSPMKMVAKEFLAQIQNRILDALSRLHEWKLAHMTREYDFVDPYERVQNWQNKPNIMQFGDSNN